MKNVKAILIGVAALVSASAFAHADGLPSEDVVVATVRKNFSKAEPIFDRTRLMP